MSDLVWSKELPTITGWYWVKENKELPPVCSFICRAAAKGHMLIELNNPNCSPNLKGWSSHYPDILFAGPIKEPMTQEEVMQRPGLKNGHRNRGGIGLSIHLVVLSSLLLPSL